MTALAAAAVIINPISGTGGRPDAARARQQQAAAMLARHGVSAEIVLTERGGHAREMTAALVAGGVKLVLAWGGDGTVNEVASALAFTPARLGIIPSGSGNGLARELRIPLDPAGAFATAFGGHERVVDCGELDGRLFFNVAGLGLDARVAHAFAAHGLVRRGFLRYAEVTARELFTYSGDDHVVLADDAHWRGRALIIALANARQYGNGALIAPGARVDDGRLDVVVVEARPVWRTLTHLPKLFNGRIAAVSGVISMPAASIAITSARPALYHVDGEPFVGGASLAARVHPGALRVMVPPA